jgi:ribosome-binding factor A
MASHRTLRMAEAIREVVANAILFEVADPRIKAVTVLRVEVAGDLRHATVFTSVMGSETDQRKAMQGLQSASGFLQSRVAARLQTRFTPILTFKTDDSVKKSIAVSKLIDEALASDRENQARAQAHVHAGDASSLPQDPGEGDDATPTSHSETETETDLAPDRDRDRDIHPSSP